MDYLVSGLLCPLLDYILCVYTTHCTKYILFPITIAINGHLILDFLLAEMTKMGRHMITTNKLHLWIASSDFSAKG